MESLLDIANLIEFLKSMRRRINDSVSIVAIDSLMHERIHYAKVELRVHSKEAEYRAWFFLNVDGGNLVRISYSTFPGVPRWKITEVRHAVQQVVQKTAPLGNMTVYMRSEGICISTEYALAVSHRWLEPKMRDAFIELLVDSMGVMYDDVNDAMRAAVKV